MLGINSSVGKKAVIAIVAVLLIATPATIWYSITQRDSVSNPASGGEDMGEIVSIEDAEILSELRKELADRGIAGKDGRYIPLSISSEPVMYGGDWLMAPITLPEEPIGSSYRDIICVFRIGEGDDLKLVAIKENGGWVDGSTLPDDIPEDLMLDITEP